MTVQIRKKKPFNPGTTGSAPEKVEEQKVDPSKEVIILVEDSIPNRNILRAILMKLGYEVLTGENGLQGLEFIERCLRDKLKLVCFISDIMMPEMDGLGFLKHVRQTESVKNLPFILVTAAADKDNVIEAGKFGATSYLLKPVTMDQIRTKFSEIFPDTAYPSLRQMQKVS